MAILLSPARGAVQRMAVWPVVRAQSYSVMMGHCPGPVVAKMESLHRPHKCRTGSHCWKERRQTFSRTISQCLGPFLRLPLLSNPRLEVVNGLALLRAMLRAIPRALQEFTAARYRLQTNQQLVQKLNAKLYIMFHLEENVVRDTVNVNAPSASY